MSEQNFNESMKPFFGNSNASGLFMGANYPLGNYSSAVNSEANPETLGSSAENVMLVKNYNSKPSGAADNDVHNNYVDFVIRAALYHREVDAPTSAGSGLEEIRKLCEKNINELLNMEIKNVDVNGGKLNKSVDYTNPTYTSTPTTIPTIINANTSQLKYINTALLMLGLSIYDGSTATHYSDALTKLKGDLNNVFSMKVSSSNTLLSHIGKLVTECNTNGTVAGSAATGNLCTILTHNSSELAGKIKNLNPRLTPDLGSFVKTAILNATKNHCLRLYQQHNIADLYNKVNVATKKFSATEIGRSVNNAVNNSDSLNKLFIKELNDNIFDSIKRNVNDAVKTNYTTLDKNHHAKELFEKVFANWGNLDRNSREFYRQHLQLFRKTGHSVGLGADEAGWEALDESSFNNASIMGSLDKTQTRLNFMKSSPGAADTLFASTLPFIPDTMKNLWMTVSGSPTKLEVKGNKK